MISAEVSTDEKYKAGIDVITTVIYSVLQLKNVVDRADIAEWLVRLYYNARNVLKRLEFRHEALPGLLTSGKLRIHNIENKQGGLEKIPEGLKELQQGKVSGKKIVYTLA